jgi:hypothetical protein
VGDTTRFDEFDGLGEAIRHMIDTMAVIGQAETNAFAQCKLVEAVSQIIS